MVKMPLVPSFSGVTLEPGATGLIGMSLNGVPAFGPQEGGGTNAVEGPAAVVGGVTVTGVPPQGHAAPSGDWHYHSGEFGLVTDIASIPRTKLIGYAMDGFPIYGALDDDSVLDECNGVGATAATYRYHIRTKAQVDETLPYCDGTSPAIQWPYILGCFKGDMTKSATVDSTTNALPSDCVLSSSGPVIAPVAAPTPAPTSQPAFPPGFCFSGDTMVQIQDQKGPIAMKNLKVGDNVLTASGSYEQVFSFGHRHNNIEAEFLHFLPSGLEISPDHMVLVD
jgi:hypothetical protein